MQAFNVQHIRENFPALSFCNAKGQRIVYLDNSATTQKPYCVIDALIDFYQRMNANVHRSFYEWGNRATEAYEHTRTSLSKFIGAQYPEEVIFTRGATESINCLADIVGQRYFQQGDEVLVSELEHHSNLIPWQMQQKKCGIQVKGWPVDAEGNLEVSTLQALLTPRTKLLAVTQVSNVLGTTPDLKNIIACAHANGTLVLVDGAQALAHLKINVQDMDCDFYVGSSHKMYGPMGVGFFYGKRKWLETLPPYHGGGTMMESVFMDSFTAAGIPKRFEAGTPPVADVIGFGKAIAYLQQFNWQSLMQYEESVIVYAERMLCAIPRVRLIGHPKTKTAIVSFLVDKIHPHDVATIVNDQNIALRAGHHCCQPLMHRLGCKGGVVRVSLGIYNTFEDIDRLAEAIDVALTVFKS